MSCEVHNSLSTSTAHGPAFSSARAGRRQRRKEARNITADGQLNCKINDEANTINTDAFQNEVELVGGLDTAVQEDLLIESSLNKSSLSPISDGDQNLLSHSRISKDLFSQTKSNRCN